MMLHNESYLIKSNNSDINYIRIKNEEYLRIICIKYSNHNLITLNMLENKNKINIIVRYFISKFIDEEIDRKNTIISDP
jgi:hypothetical protein